MSSGPLFSDTVPARTRNTSGAVVTAHCDGGSRGNPGPSGYGAVVTAADGTVLAQLSEFLGRRTNNYAEYSGLLATLAWALEHGVDDLRVISDSELMVKQVQGRYKVNSPDLRPLFEEARRRIGRLGSFTITHALRHKNKDADRLANEAMDRGTGKARTSAEDAKTPVLLAPHERRAPQERAPAVSPPARPTTTAAPAMLRGFVKDGTIHLLGGKTLPDGSLVKIIME